MKQKDTEKRNTKARNIIDKYWNVHKETIMGKLKAQNESFENASESALHKLFESDVKVRANDLVKKEGMIKVKNIKGRMVKAIDYKKVKTNKIYYKAIKEVLNTNSYTSYKERYNESVKKQIKADSVMSKQLDTFLKGSGKAGYIINTEYEGGVTVEGKSYIKYKLENRRHEFIYFYVAQSPDNALYSSFLSGDNYE